MKKQKLEEIVSIMDARGISVSDIQQYLEQKKVASTVYDAVLSKRKKRRANQERRKALRLARQKSPANKPKSDNEQPEGVRDRAKSKQTAKRKTTKSKSSGENSKQTNRQTESRVN
jgi:hypothetical protein